MWTTTLALALLGAASGQEPQEPEAPRTAEELRAAFVELEDAFDEARQDWYAEVNAAYEAFQESADQSGGFSMPEPIEPDWYPRFVEIADAGSVDANLWCVRNHGHSGLNGAEARTDKSRRYLDLLSESRPNEMLIQVAFALMGDGQAALMGGDADEGIGRGGAFRFLDLIDRMTDDADVRVTTLYVRGQSLISYGASAEESKDGLVFYRRAAKEYPDSDLGKRCGGMVFAAENLQIGQKAPDIVGKAHDGSDLALSDFEGKVTVIDFWGFW